MEWTPIFLPFALLLTRVAAFISAAPIVGGKSTPNVFKVGFSLILTIFLGSYVVFPPYLGEVHWARAIVMLMHELLCGLAFGLAASLVFAAVEQGGRMMGRSMGMAMAQIMNPASGESSQPVALIFSMCFILLFLGAGGHHVLITVIVRSYEAFPVGSPPNIAAMADLVVEAGSTMLLFALRLASPILAATLLLSVVLGIVARLVPEMNILMLSMPMRLGMGLIVAAALFPSLTGFTEDIASWMARHLIA